MFDMIVKAAVALVQLQLFLNEHKPTQFTALWAHNNKHVNL